MSKAILIQCTKSKRDEAAMAINLYDESDLFCKMRSYSQATGHPWFILSAKHGLLEPTEWVEPYDEFGLTENQSHTIANQIKLKGFDEVELIAGSKYTNPLTPEFESHGIEVHELCRGMKIGDRMKELDRLKRKEMNQSLC